MTEDEKKGLMGRIDSLVEDFNNLNHDDSGEAWAGAGSALGELAGIARGALYTAGELRRQLERADNRIQLLEVREINLVNQLAGVEQPD